MCFKSKTQTGSESANFKPSVTSQPLLGIWNDQQELIWESESERRAGAVHTDTVGRGHEDI